MTRAHGWIPEPREFSLGRVDMGRGVTLLPSVELPFPPIRDQGAHPSCVGFALSRALHIRALVQRTVNARPFAPSWLWYHGRRDPSLETGMTLSAAFGVLTDLGCPSEEWCPYPLADGHAPPDEAAQHAYDQRGGFGARPVYGSHDILCALSLGYPVVLGTVQRHGGPHATVLAGYTSGGRVREDNSWGTDWEQGGSTTLDAEYLDTDDVLGAWAVTWTPSPSEDAR